MNRVMTAGLDRRWRRITIERDRAPRRPRRSTRAAAPAISRSARARDGARRRRARLLRADARARAAQGARDRVRAGRHARAAVRRRVVRLGHGRLRRAQRRGSRGGHRASCAACCATAGGSASSRSRRRAAGSRRSTASGSTASCPLLGKVLPGGSAYTYLPASVRRFPDAGRARARCSSEHGFSDVRYRTFAGGIVALHVGEATCVSTTAETLACDPRGRRARGVPRRARGAARAHGREPSRPRRGRRQRGARRRRASGCGPLLVFLSTPPGESRRSPPASPSSSCTWRRSSTTT